MPTATPTVPGIAGDKSATAAAEEWTTALHVAVEQRTVLAFMLARLVDVLLNIRLRDRTTPLMLACRFGDRCVRVWSSYVTTGATSTRRTARAMTRCGSPSTAATTTTMAASSGSERVG